MSPPALQARDVTVQRNGATLVARVSFKAEHGAVTGVLGPNGAGKTTLLRACLGLLPFDGKVYVEGRSLEDLDRMQRARTIAYVPQRSALSTSMPVRSVVAMGRYGHDPLAARLDAEDETAVDDALARMDIRHIAARDYLDCSGGEQRRVLLARALATQARVLVLDEPTENLDIRHRLELQALLRGLAAAGHAVVSVFHDLNEARACCDRGVLLDRGELASSGPIGEVLSSTVVERVFGVRPVPGSNGSYEVVSDPS